uniref:Col_cuticle_N domain-containing protein n=1 Tax=Ascaris lumbricoides TaxID=6252 RepID=A0A0M3IJZ9_ASCLU
MVEGSNERYAKDLRKLVQQTSAVAIFSVLTAVIVIPMIYNYSQHIETALDSEVRFCNHRTTDLLLEFTRHIETALDSEVRFCNHRTTDLLLEFTRVSIQFEAMIPCLPGSFNMGKCGI